MDLVHTGMGCQAIVSIKIQIVDLLSQWNVTDETHA